MEYAPTLRDFGPAPSEDQVNALLDNIRSLSQTNCREEVYRRCWWITLK